MKEVQPNTTNEYTYLGGDAYTAPVVVNNARGVVSYYYLLRDYLGNITHQVNTSNAVVAEYSFDAWGRRRNATNWTYTLDANDKALFADRGFTGHEYLPWFKLYNMNGRLYDPAVGRFLNVDPVVQDPNSTPSLNRFTYCMNNPLKYADYNGYTWFTHLGNWLGKNGKAIVSTVATIGVAAGVTAIIVASGGTLAPLAIAAIAGASGGFAGGALNTAFAGGSGKDYLINGGMGALVGGASAFVGGALGQWAVKGLKSFAVNGIASPLLKSSLTGLVGGMAGGYGGGFVGGFIQSGGDLAAANKAGLNGLVMGGALGMASGAYTGYKQAQSMEVDPWTGKVQRNSVNSARTNPVSLSEQLTLEEAQSGQGQEIMKGKVNDPNWDGWQKMQHSHQLPSGDNITIHYWHNPETNVNTGFKFKTPPRY